MSLVSVTSLIKTWASLLPKKKNWYVYFALICFYVLFTLAHTHYMLTTRLWHTNVLYHPHKNISIHLSPFNTFLLISMVEGQHDFLCICRGFEPSVWDSSGPLNSQDVAVEVQSVWWETAGLTAAHLSSRPAGQKTEQNDEKPQV